MTTAKTTYLGELRTESIHLQSSSKIITDAPTDNQGKGEAFSPTDCCATSLAMCMLTIIGIHIQKHDFDIMDSFAEVTKIMASDPRRICKIEVKMTIKTSRQITDNEKKSLQNAGLNCPVAKSLHPDIIQAVSFSYA